MSITVYTIGDHETIRAALNGVAMLFDPAQGMLTGVGGIGLGQFAGFGLLVSFVTIVISGVLHQKMEFHHLIVGLVMYTIMFVPQTTVNITDMSTGQTAVVDHVPIGVAYPGGIISTFTHAVAIAIETTMKTASSSYLPQTDVGFAGPLQLMLAARNAATSGDPMFAKNYSYFMGDCVRPVADPNKIAYVTDLKDIVSEVAGGGGALGFGVQSSAFSTMYFTAVNTAGTMIPCTTSATNLQNDYNNLFNVNNYVQGNTSQNTIEAHMNPAMLKKPSVNPMDKWAISDLDSAIVTLTGAGVDSQKVMTTLIMGDLVYNTYTCGPNDTVEYLKCQSSMASNMESYKMEAATSGSMFQKTMIPSMNIFMFFFYSFSPVIAILVAMSGMKGVVQIVPKYLLFGVWTQTWIPAAAIINFFMQMQTQEAINNQLVTSDGIPLANTMALYHTLSTKLAAASEMLAMAPMVTLALITGSMFALAQIAGRNQKPDVGALAPKSVNVAAAGEAVPLVSNADATRKMGGLENYAAGAPKGLFSAELTQQSSTALKVKTQNALEQAQTQQVAHASVAGEDFAQSYSGGHSKTNFLANSANNTNGHSRLLNFTEGKDKGQSTRLSEADQKTLDLSLNAVGDFAASAMVEGIKQGYAGKSLKKFVATATGKFANEAIMGKGGLIDKANKGLPQAGLREAFSTAVDKTLGEKFSDSNTTTDTWAAEHTEGRGNRDEHNFADKASATYKNGDTKTLTRVNADVKKASEAAELARSTTVSGSGSYKVDETRSGVAGAKSAKLMEWMRSASKEEGLDEPGGAVDQAKTSLAQYRRFEGQPEQREAAAMAWALSNSGRGAELAQRVMAAETGVDKVGSTPAPTKLAEEAAAIKKGTEEAGLKPQQKKDVDEMAVNADAGADKARGKTANIPGKLKAVESAATPDNPGLLQTFAEGSKNADNKADASGVGAANDARVLNSAPSAEFEKQSAVEMAKFKQSHGFKELGDKLGKDVLNDPVLKAIAGVGGAAAVGSVLSAILEHAPRDYLGRGGKGQSVGQYAKKVLQKLAPMLPGMGAKIVAKHAAATAVGAGGLAVGLAAANIIATGSDVWDAGVAIKQAITEVNKDDATAAGKSPPSPPQVAVATGVQPDAAVVPTTQDVGSKATSPVQTKPVEVAVSDNTPGNLSKIVNAPSSVSHAHKDGSQVTIGPSPLSGGIASSSNSAGPDVQLTKPVEVAHISASHGNDEGSQLTIGTSPQSSRIATGNQKNGPDVRLPTPVEVAHASPSHGGGNGSQLTIGASPLSGGSPTDNNKKGTDEPTTRVRSTDKA